LISLIVSIVKIIKKLLLQLDLQFI